MTDTQREPTDPNRPVVVNVGRRSTQDLAATRQRGLGEPPRNGVGE